MSLIAKVKPVAVLASPEVGDQLTETLVKSPPSPEVILDFVINPKIQAVFTGFTLNIGKDTALFEPPMVKSEEPEEVDTSRVGGLGQPRTVTVIEVSKEVRGMPPAPA